jgi:hypothetical protein
MRAKRLWNRVNAQILVWAGEDPLRLRYDGRHILLPPRNETATTGKGKPYAFESAKDGRDRHIPGTLKVTDVILSTPEGGFTKTFDVGQFCEFLERDRAYLFERGLEIVTDPKDVEPAREAALPGYERSQDARAQQILSTELDRIAKYDAKGQPTPEGSNSGRVAWAVSHLQRRDTADVAQFNAKDIKAVLSGQYLPPKKEEADALERLTAKQIVEEAQEVGVNVTKTEMLALIEGDNEQIDFILEKIKVKKEAQATA